ncbi:MAG: hypothetical protein LBB75_08720 [Oscillospiraceae bacterium]|jgi:hypothetical protein|nr:hypothetical protein [Oscillospiraceae bacterium]
MNSTLDSLRLINYREAGGLPLRSITRLPEAEANALAHRLAQESLSRNNRYRDGYWEGYYRSRLRTEAWLCDAFAARGGEPQTRHPIYFALGESARNSSFFGTHDFVKIPLRDIDPLHVSFTPRDSMHIYHMGLPDRDCCTEDWSAALLSSRIEARGRAMLEKAGHAVWDKATLIELFALFGNGDAAAFTASVPEAFAQPGGYIEVQVWSDIYFA